MIKLGEVEGISNLYYEDNWFKSMVIEISELYGYPASAEAALTENERVKSTIATINVSMALEEYLSEWYHLWEDKVPVTEELAVNFCRKFHELTGHHIL